MLIWGGLTVGFGSCVNGPLLCELIVCVCFLVILVGCLWMIMGSVCLHYSLLLLMT